jgi:hypothetical protein
LRIAPCIICLIERSETNPPPPKSQPAPLQIGQISKARLQSKSFSGENLDARGPPDACIGDHVRSCVPPEVFFFAHVRPKWKRLVVHVCPNVVSILSNSEQCNRTILPPPPRKTGKYPTHAVLPHLGTGETFTFPKRPLLDIRCRVQFETFQYTVVLW